MPPFRASLNLINELTAGACFSLLCARAPGPGRSFPSSSPPTASRGPWRRGWPTPRVSRRSPGCSRPCGRSPTQPSAPYPSPASSTASASTSRRSTSSEIFSSLDQGRGLLHVAFRILQSNRLMPRKAMRPTRVLSTSKPHRRRENENRDRRGRASFRLLFISHAAQGTGLAWRATHSRWVFRPLVIPPVALGCVCHVYSYIPEEVLQRRTGRRA